MPRRKFFKDEENPYDYAIQTSTGSEFRNEETGAIEAVSTPVNPGVAPLDNTEVTGGIVGWDKVSGGVNSAKDRATQGATAGIDLKDSDSTVLEDTDVKNVANYTAGVALTSGQAVYLYTDGLVYSTDALVSEQTAAFIGFVLEDVALGAAGRIKIIGNIDQGLSGLSVGVNYYLSDATNSQDITTFSPGAFDYVAMTSPEAQYQSFITGSVNHISRIDASMQTTAGHKTITVRVREGTGVGGTLISSKVFTVDTGGGVATVVFLFDIPMPVKATTTYSVTFETSDGNANIVNRLADGYANGRNDQSATNDYNIQTFDSTGRGAIGTSAGTNSKKAGISLAATSLLLLNT